MLDTPPLPPVPPAARTVGAATPQGLRKVAAEFEAMLAGQLLESMFAGIETDGPFGGGPSEATWRSFMLREYGAAIAETGALGIGRAVHEQVALLYGGADATGE